MERIRSVVFPVFVVLVIIVLDVSGGTHVELTSSPSEVQYPVTSSLAVRCALSTSPVTSVNPVTSTSNPGLVGRRRSSSSPEEIEHVTGITISRNDVIVATITLFSQAQVESQADLSNVKVTGDLKVNSGTEKGYLELVWSFPLASQTGSYECSVAGVSASNHQTVTTEVVEVKATTVDTDDLLSEISALKKLFLEQRNITQQQQSNIASQKASIASLQKQIDAEKATNAQQQTKIASLTQDLSDLSHVEQGVIDCGRSTTWKDGDYTAPWQLNQHFPVTKSVRVNFKTPFVKPPVVQLSIYSFYNHKDQHEEYGAIVEKVDANGFTMRCMTWGNGGFEVLDMDVSWITVATV